MCLPTLLVDAEPMNVDYHPHDPGGAYLANHGNGTVSRLDLERSEISDRWPSTPAGRNGQPEDIAFVGLAKGRMKTGGADG